MARLPTSVPTFPSTAAASLVPFPPPFVSPTVTVSSSGVGIATRVLSVVLLASAASTPQPASVLPPPTPSLGTLIRRRSSPVVSNAPCTANALIATGLAP